MSKAKKEKKPTAFAVPAKARARLERLYSEAQMAQSKLVDAAGLCRDLMNLGDEYQLRVPGWVFEKESEPQADKREADNKPEDVKAAD